MFTVYESGFFSDSKDMDFPEILEILRSVKTRNQVQTIRNSDPDIANRIKKKLPVALFSGVFARNPAGAARIADFLEPSGYMVLDYDDIEDLAALRAFVEQDPATALAFESPGGAGLKAVVAVCPSPVDTTTAHQAFEALSTHFLTSYGIPNDDGKNLNRACFLGHDPALYFNPNPVPILAGRHAKALNRINPDEDYEQWRTVIMALHSEDPDGNLAIAHAWSARGAKYDPVKLDSRWHGFVQDGGVTIRDLYELAGIPSEAKALISIDEEGLAAALTLLDLDIYWNIRTQRLTLDDNGLDYNAQDSILIRSIAQQCTAPVGRSERPARFTKAQVYDWLPSVVPHRDHFLAYLESLPAFDLDQPSVLARMAVEALGVSKLEAAVSELLMKWMLGVVTLQFNKEAPLDFVPILVGKQGMGKTRFVKELLPLELRQYYVDVSLTDTADKARLLEKVVGCVVVEFSEFQEGSKIGIGSLRSILSSSYIRTRLPYRRDAADYPVTWGIMGTANPGYGVLPESAEGRRWYAIDINTTTDRVAGWLGEHRESLWSEAYTRYKEGEDFHLSQGLINAHTELNKGQEKPEYRSIREFIAANEPFDVRDLKEASGVGQRLPRFMSGALEEAGWHNKVARVLGRSTTVYFPPGFDLANWREGILMIEQSAGTNMTFNGVSAN